MDKAAIVILLALILVALVVLIAVLLRRRSGPAAQAPAAPRDPFAAEDQVAGDPRALKARATWSSTSAPATSSAARCG
ncbi:hypothetical protein [Actinomadura madurae]|uniref:hypothetical protein n=1 Tax=Actinomadura madurae TaxID=1993 RepID=UPI0027E22E8C|nr:hypothetical protein [Actinomadura madurae]